MSESKKLIEKYRAEIEMKEALIAEIESCDLTDYVITLDVHDKTNDQRDVITLRLDSALDFANIVESIIDHISTQHDTYVCDTESEQIQKISKRDNLSST